MAAYLSDNCHTYDINNLDKHILKYPIIKVETKSLHHLIKQSSSDEPTAFKHISKRIVLFNDLNPISNWIDSLKNDYANIIKKTRTKYITCIFLKYTDLYEYIIRPNNPLIHSKKSTIHGKGIFAVNTISKGTEIMRFIDHIKGMPFMYNDSYLINHSSKHPNVHLKYYNSNGCNYSIAVSNRLIHKNEEILIDYLTTTDMYPWLGEITFEEK